MFKQAAIGLLVLIGVAAAVVGTVRMLRPQMDERLYAHYRKFPTIALPDSTSEPLQQAVVLFSQKNYTRTLAQLSRADSLNIHACWLSALAHLELEHYPQSITQFDILHQQQVIPTDAVNWYEALLYLRKHDRTKSRQLLQTIPANSPHKDMADTLLKKIE